MLCPSGANRAVPMFPRRNVSRRYVGVDAEGGFQRKCPAAKAATSAATPRIVHHGSLRAPRAAAAATAVPELPESSPRLNARSRADWKRALRILLEAVADDALETRRDVLVGDGKIRRILAQDRRHRVRGRVAVECALARQHLVEDRPEGEDVAAGVGGLAADLLGRHVAERAQDDAGLGAPGLRREVRPARVRALGLCQLGEAEVEDLDASVFGDEDVLGLQVAVDDALLVRGRQALGDLRRVVDRPCAARSGRPRARAERLALEQLLDDVGRAVVLPDVVDRRDVGMVEDARPPSPPARSGEAGPRPARTTPAGP